MATPTTRLFLRRASAFAASAPRSRMLHSTPARLDKAGATTRPNANPGGSRQHANSGEHRANETARRGLNPALPAGESAEGVMPRVGVKVAPPELAGEVKMDGEREFGKQEGEMEVGELEGGTFRIEPLKRRGEDEATIRARLLYQSRKRGTLESDLLMSTFADAHLGDMNLAQLRELDRFLDENDWDIYYWATQEEAPQPGDREGDVAGAYAGTQGDAGRTVRPGKGEWAQTVGTFKPLYRPVPARWRGSEVLARLRRHVGERSAGGVGEGGEGKGEGMAFMPAVKKFEG